MSTLWDGLVKISSQNDADESLDNLVNASLESSKIKKNNKNYNLIRNAERALFKNQLEKMHNDARIGGGIGGGLGFLIGVHRGGATPILTTPLGMILGATLGTGVGANRGAYGSDASALRKKYFGTDDIEKIRKKYFSHLYK